MDNKKKSINQPDPLLKEKEEEKLPELTIPKWPCSKIIEISDDALGNSKAREGVVSRIDYKSQGFRRYVIELEIELMAKEGCGYVNIHSLIDKKFIEEEIKKLSVVYGPKFKDLAINHTVALAAHELASILPRIKKPPSLMVKNKNPWVKYYVYPSLPIDGKYGEVIFQKLHEIRCAEKDRKGNFLGGDIMVGKQGGERRFVKFINKVHWHLVPRKTRMPSKYHSQYAEKEIETREERTTQSYPDLYVVGCGASSLYVPDGIRKRPYVTVGASHRLETETVGIGSENQESITIIDYVSSEERLVRVWSFKDLIAKERLFISEVKKNASNVAKKIDELIKKEGNRSIGEMADELNYDETTIEREVNSLIEKENSKKRNYPGLWRNLHSQRYDYNLDWIQKQLSIPFPKNEWMEEISLNLACMHAGYDTTDYQFLVKKMPEIILKRNVKILRIAGDLIAGLKHDYFHSGEVIGSLNNTDQEQFAGELIATIAIKVFRARFEKMLENFSSKPLKSKDIEKIAEESLFSIEYIPGNHDLWQEKDGHTPLSEFTHRLKELLFKYITKTLIEKHLEAINLSELIDKKVRGFSDFMAVYTSPSELKIEMKHPHMASAKTTSLRIQNALNNSEANVVIQANFHAAVVDHIWYSDRGQCVGVQIGCMQIYTRFEKRKQKIKPDFGPVFLRVLSHKGRIWMTETGYYNKPFLEVPLPKWTDVPKLKHQLGLLDYE